MIALASLCCLESCHGRRRTRTGADSGTAENVANPQESLVVDQEAEQRSTQSRPTCQCNTKSSCTSTHPKWQGTTQAATEQDQTMRPRKPRLWCWSIHNHWTAKLVKASEKWESCWTRRNPDEKIKNLKPVTMQWVLSRLPRLWRQAQVVALLKPGKGPSSPNSFRSISQTIRVPDTEPPVSHYRICPYTRAGWLPPRQILYCPGAEPHQAHWIWLWKRENHRHNILLPYISRLLMTLSTIGDCLRRSTTWQGTAAWCASFALYWRTVVSSWNSEGKEVDGDRRGTAYCGGVSSHHFSSTYI